MLSAPKPFSRISSSAASTMVSRVRPRGLGPAAVVIRVPYAYGQRESSPAGSEAGARRPPLGDPTALRRTEAYPCPTGQSVNGCQERWTRAILRPRRTPMDLYAAMRTAISTRDFEEDPVPEEIL